MAHAQLPIVRRRFGATMRQDSWWVQPAIVFLVLSAFIGYATWAAFQGEHYTYGPYLSPFYSPELFGSSPHAWFGPKPAWWPAWLVFSPALLILPFPGIFRVTCYYYRGAYYKAFWADPPACAVGEPRKTYWVRRRSPHRAEHPPLFPLYRRCSSCWCCLYDVWKALWFTDPATGRTSFGIGVGTLVLATNVVLLGGYTLGCHSLRHVIGGYLDRLSGHPVRRRPTTAPAASTAPTCGGPGAASSRWRSPISTSGSARWASGPTGGSSDRLPDLRARRPGDRRRRRRAPRRDRGVRGGRVKVGLGLQVAAGEGAHRDGRRRRRGGAGERGRPGQLAGPLRRHHARRPVRQQLAHGRAARRRRRRTGSASWRRGARCSTARPTAGSSSATSAGTSIPGWRTWATGPAWR